VILRRLYLYVVSAAALVLLAFGLTGAGSTLLVFLFNSPAAEFSRPELAQWLAATVVALPVWGIHQWFARRFALRDPAERASAIRHLYLYWACLVFAVAFVINLDHALASLLMHTLDNQSRDDLQTSQAGWNSAVLLVIWAVHFAIASRDRAAVGEKGASSTLRRWYMYGALLIGLLMLLAGTAEVLQMLWLRAMHSGLVNNFSLSSAAALMLAGGLLWAFHARFLATRYIEDDRKSTLRAVEGFIIVGFSIGSALYGGSLILYYSLARILGVQNPGGIGDDLLAGLAQPGTMLLVYSTSWLFVRRRLSRDAATGEASRQAAIRRLYINLAALVSLGAMASGAGGVLWTLAEQVEAPMIGVSAFDWRNGLSLWITLFVVGGAVWLAHWRPSPPPPDRQSLSRRLHVWAALLASVLALLGFSVALLYSVIQQVIQPHPRLDDLSNLDFGHYLAALVIAAIVGLYHLGVLRSDAKTRPAVVEPEATAPAVIAAVPVEESPVAVQAAIDLVDWRRRVGDLYRISGPEAMAEFRRRRDELFKTHPQSPIEPEERFAFMSLTYFAPDPAYRVKARFEAGRGDTLVIDTGGADGAVRYRRAGRLVFELNGEACELTVLGLQQYAGGLFVPFKDATSGHETYGGGRYLFDTAKNTDGLVLELEVDSQDVTIDFNYAYNPSCVYSPRWACPLAPPENLLKVAIRAGEQTYRAPDAAPAGGPV
jgi:uncharacterized protein (DUF1684 family)/TRAP-type mannitol/chloroaromatic compound transport system permease small subunit